MTFDRKIIRLTLSLDKTRSRIGFCVYKRQSGTPPSSFLFLHMDVVLDCASVAHVFAEQSFA